MTIDLSHLDERHPSLPPALAQSLGLHAAVALERRHRPGVELAATRGTEETKHALIWALAGAAATLQVDQHRATEDGAEAVALGLVHERHRWAVRRRLQRRQYGDWLLAEAGTPRLIVFEVGGMDQGALPAKLAGELEQVRRSPLPYDRVACVVRFSDVSAMLELVPYDPR